MNKKFLQKLVVLLVLILFINLPLVTALQISNIQVKEITDTTAVVEWKTDEEADSFLHYGETAENLRSLGDADELNVHEIKISDLRPETNYLFKVESGTVTDDNTGALHSFKTLPPDTEAPSLTLNLPEKVKGNYLDIAGKSEIGATINLIINGFFKRTTVAEQVNETSEGQFYFPEVLLNENQENNITLEAFDRSGNKAVFTGKVISDNQRPILKMGDVPSFLGEKSYDFKGEVSEKVKWEILLNNKSVSKGEGTSFAYKASLDEGANKIQIVLTDEAGFNTVKEFEVSADTKPPTVEAKLAKGNEYYQGRAFTDITGETEPGAAVYLYVYKPLGYEFKPDFKKARAKVTANEEGEFIFKDVRIESSIVDISLEDLAPREVPSDLINTIIYPIKEITEQQELTYYLYIVPEDRSGKVGKSWQQTVTVHSCFSGGLDFTLESVPEFQGPLRLVPNLMDEGRQEIQAVFKLTYNGEGAPKLDASGNEIEPAFQIKTVNIEEACTQGMAKDPTTGVACKIFPSRPSQMLPNGDKTSLYVKWNLGRTEDMSKNEDDFWNDLKKRNLVFPLKITVNYQERIGQEGDLEKWENKLQTSCTDLAFMVDVPIDTKKMIPDFLANEMVDFLNGTVEVIQTVLPIVEKVFYVTGIVCMSFSALKWVARFIREFAAKSEGVAALVGQIVSGGKLNCPLVMNDLYLDSTIKNWYELMNNGVDSSNFPKNVREAYEADNHEIGEKTKQISLNERCPSTAGAWKFEEAMDLALKWSCDRAFCRKVPAGWTEDKDLDEIGAAIIRQNQCAVTGKGIPLIRRENCQNYVQTNYLTLPTGVAKDEVGICWQTKEGILYYDDGKQDREEAQKGFFKLTPIGKIFGNLQVPSVPLRVYKPAGSTDFYVGRDQSCQSVCEELKGKGYGPLRDNSVGDKGCFIEGSDGKFLDENNHPLSSKNAFSAGYTKDCFVEETGSEPRLMQCLCQGKKTEMQPVASEDGSKRTALKKEGDHEEKWSYRQAQIYKESRGLMGTYYPKERYYSGRDIAGAFGANYLFDYFKGKPEIPAVDPHDDIVQSFQTVCLTGILKNLKMIEAITTGLLNCIREAKHTGFQDAGMCKTLFTQHLCGLVYKGLAYLTQDCSPNNFDDAKRDEQDSGALGDFGAVISNLIGAMSSSLDSSISDLKEEYGNAQLNQYFEGGTQGFVQSICLAAFGFETPLFSEDFLMDAAYAFPMQSSLFIAPAWREFSTYNPARSTAVYNYEIGGAIYPGCKIKRYDVKLKCIGPEDIGGLGVDLSCNGAGCDCLNAQTASSPYQNEMEKVIKSGFNLPTNQLFNLPIESPLRIDNSHYRYDHIVVELQLDPAEKGNVNKCFDEKVIKGNKAVYYYPLKDVSPPGEVACTANLITGQFECNELSALFGFGGAYLEQPYVTCWNKKTESWVDCEKTENLFLLSDHDEIKVRVHINNDDKGKCLKQTSSTPGITERIYTLPENTPGQMFPPYIIGTVGPQMFGGAADVLKKIPTESNSGCKELSYIGSPENAQQRDYKFIFNSKGGDQIEVIIPSGVIPSGSFTGTRGQINDLNFNIQGFSASNVLGDVNPTDDKNYCTYRILPQSAYAKSANKKYLDVTYELLERDGNGLCSLATTQVKANVGKSLHTQRISIQQTESAFQSESGMHANFMNGNYAVVQDLAASIINQERNDLTHVVAIYYSLAAYLMEGKKAGDIKQYGGAIKKLLKLFFEREWVNGKIEPLSSDATTTAEYKKIEKYLCEIDRIKFEANYKSYCDGAIVVKNG